ncbi:conserved hypothetical protein [Candidatus Nitrotoga sp. BS]|uniref:type I CRISPR-associated protein Cas7 n=1 Tax=Candidatus Nitrotoga sp. BS TaxID=2890408 RepID=UPI001EF3541F|nr:type I CRISPR-associated protein Cas7 [Candidatus Nitrotoga sp. BS]CAH1204115.1 conserved hypothetical protein [Candidatus Nitrotoga sp. BS]
MGQVASLINLQTSFSSFVNSISLLIFTDQATCPVTRYYYYGLYAAHGFVSSFLAKQTDFDGNDLELLWQALGQMFEHDRSAARGEMTTRGLYVFKHESELGNAPAHKLFELIQAKKNTDEPARDFADYTVLVKEAAIPAGVTLQRKVG